MFLMSEVPMYALLANKWVLWLMPCESVSALERPRKVWGSGFRAQGSGFDFQGSGFKVQGFGFSVQGDRTHSPRFAGTVAVAC